MKKLLLLSVLVAPFAFAAEELKPVQEEAKAKFDTETADALKAMNDKCGTKAALKTDFQNFKAEAWSGSSYSGYCTSVLDGVAAMCERPAYKKVLTKKLTAVGCLFGGVKPKTPKDGSAEPTQRNMSFEKGEFLYHMSTEHSNLGDNTKAVLEKALN